MTTEPTDQRKALEEAFKAIWPEPHFITDGPADWDVWGARRDRFTAMLDAGAWLSAAEMLVPPGAYWKVVRYRDDLAQAEIYGTVTKDGPDPALAILSAVLAARGQNAEPR